MFKMIHIYIHIYIYNAIQFFIIHHFEAPRGLARRAATIILAGKWRSFEASFMGSFRGSFRGSFKGSFKGCFKESLKGSLKITLKGSLKGTLKATLMGLKVSESLKVYCRLCGSLPGLLKTCSFKGYCNKVSGLQGPHNKPQTSYEN